MSIAGIFLPEEIVIEIISNLPAKSLIRFKSVCKPWCSLFSSPSYMARNLLPDRNDDNLLLVKHYHKTTQQHSLSLLSDRTLAQLDDEQSRALVPPPCPHEDDYPLPEILGCCNDVVCLTSTVPDPRIALWSLATGDVRFLPPAAPPRSEDSEFGFGYDADSKDYKVIRIASESRDTMEVYSFQSNSWRGMDCSDLLPVYVVSGNHFTRAYTDGIFSWLAIDPQVDYSSYDDFCNSVLWFRFSDESFGTFKLPPERFRHFTYGVNKFFVLGDRMSIVVYNKDQRVVQRSFQVWVMLEFGVEDSWTILFTLGPLVGIDVPLWFWNNGKMIMQHRDGHFVLCDPFGQEIEPLDMDALPDDTLSFIQIISVPAKYIYNT